MKVYVLHFAAYDPHTVLIYADEAKAVERVAAYNEVMGPASTWYDEYEVIL